MSYEEALDIIRERDVPVALVYGREDPWVTPLWGQRLKRRVPSATYYEVSKCGHCPHHEAPEVVNEIIKRWMNAVSAGAPPPEEPVVGGGGLRLVVGKRNELLCNWVYMKGEGIPGRILEASLVCQTTVTHEPCWIAQPPNCQTLCLSLVSTRTKTTLLVAFILFHRFVHDTIHRGGQRRFLAPWR